jgi:FAD/FMN-containing dehydrogenase
MLGGLLLFPFDRAREILFAYREIAAAAPDALTMMAAVLTPPPVGAPALAILVGYNGPPEEGAALIQPLKDMQPLADMTGPMGYRQLQQMLDADFPFGLQNYWKSDFLSGLTDGVIDTVLEHYANATSPMTAIVIEQFGGAYRRMATGATAFSHRDWDFNLLILSRWEQASESERHIQWTRNLWNAIQPFAAGGVYVNYLEGGQEGVDRIRKAYGPSYDRLAALKTQYDPTNLFSMNQNVRPE